MGTKVPSSGEVPGERTRTSSSNRIEGLNKSYANTPAGVGSRLDPSRARASAASSEDMMKHETVKFFL
jgi:hypothetical protein